MLAGSLRRSMQFSKLKYLRIMYSPQWTGVAWIQNFIFQQHNAKIHTAKIAKDYIKKSKIPLMDWPANSPDLNPMETIEAYLKE
jgi:hypothetical protein